jgi:hypothetical protein
VLSVLIFQLISQLLCAVDLVLVNKTESPLFEVYFCPQNSSEWGQDILPYAVIMPDSYVTITVDSLSGGALYKIRLVDEDGEIYLKHNVDLNLRKKILIQPKDLLALSPDRRFTFTLVNHTGDTITGLYISPETEDSWGDNLIEDYFLNGAEQPILLPSDQDSAFYDIRFDMRENSYIQKHVFLSYRARILLSLQ